MATNKYSRLKSGIEKLNWEGKTNKQKFDYLVKKYKKLDIKLPEYLKDFHKANSRNLNGGFNKVKKEVNKLWKQEEHKIIVEESKAIDKKIFNKRLREYKEKVDTNNEIILNAEGHIRNFLLYDMKVNNVENVMSFLRGGNVNLNGVLSGDYRSQDPLLGLYSKDTEFGNAKAVLRKIRRMNEKMNLIFTNGKLDKNKMKKVLGPDKTFIKKFKRELEKYRFSGYNIDYDILINIFSKMPSYQQERFLEEALPTMKEKYRTSKDGGDFPEDINSASEKMENFIYNMFFELKAFM